MSDTVLVIEDEVDLAATLEYNLRAEGLQTRVAHTGGAGLEAAAAEPAPDVVILDLMLPDLPGTEVCRRLRASERTRGIPIIMCTAKGSEIDRVVGFEVGADDYIVKPFSVRELLLRGSRRCCAGPTAPSPRPRRSSSGACGSIVRPTACGWIRTRSR
jgi:two-component system phosphate regulon response regulator PhoB